VGVPLLIAATALFMFIAAAVAELKSRPALRG